MYVPEALLMLSARFLFCSALAFHYICAKINFKHYGTIQTYIIKA